METDLPRIHLGQNVLSNLDEASRKEWLVTNGIGGYASSTILGVNTRKYHGLLVAALNPPVDRWVLLAKLDEEIQVGSVTHPLGSNEFKHGVNPEGYRFLLDFSLSPLPTYRYDVKGVRLKKRIFMPYGKNVTIATYETFNPHDERVYIRISPLINCRHFHNVTDKDNLTWNFNQRSSEGGTIIQPSIPLSTIVISSSNKGFFKEDGMWVEEVYFRVDASRGESCLDDYFRPGWFEFAISPNERKRFHIFATAGKNEEEAQRLFCSIPKGSEDLDALYGQELERRKDLFAKFQQRYGDLEIKDWLKWLVLAANSFIVKRRSTEKRSVIAGYHWFEDWGRDSLISLPGLTFVTGRFEDAREILLTFKHYCRDGVIPNRFPDRTGDTPIFNTVDATLWFFNATLQYLKYTCDFNFVQEKLWDTMNDIIETHVRGTVYDIHMEEDGLIAHGPQLTWMDATANEVFVTPRDGEAVEIQALWYNALRTMQLLAKRFNQKDEERRYSSMAEEVAKVFPEKFWCSEKAFLFDVVQKNQNDSSLRPNQVIAAALDFSMLDARKREEIVEKVWKRLWGTYGLRTLSDDDPQYVGQYSGDWNRRGKAYHNGTVWAWLVGPFTTAFLKIKNHDEYWRNFAFKNFLQPLFQEGILKSGLGTISEIFDGNHPHSPRGCIAQAWSVAEPLRAFVEDVALKRPPYEQEVLGTLSGR